MRVSSIDSVSATPVYLKPARSLKRPSVRAHRTEPSTFRSQMTLGNTSPDAEAFLPDLP
jgi:hypothetical protein